VKAFFVITYDDSGLPNLPPMDSSDDSELSLCYTDENGQRAGGYAIVSGRLEPTSIALVHSTPEVIAAMAADTANYLFVVEQEETTAGPTTRGIKPLVGKPDKPSKTKTQKFLRGKGHPQAGLDRQKWETTDDVTNSILTMHSWRPEMLAGQSVG
jgi:hypothetical protein